MAYHGQAREEQRRRDYFATELMALGERIGEVERRLDEAKAALAAIERGWPVDRVQTLNGELI